jgi:hypothetical protein
MEATHVVCVKVKDIRPKYKNLKDWMDDPNNIYIGRKGIVFIDGVRFPKRDSIWCNPYKINSTNDRSSVLKLYREHIISKLNRGEISSEELFSLKGKNLGCWCHPESCHGDIIIELIKERC